jgi:hypothetical protein
LARILKLTSRSSAGNAFSLDDAFFAETFFEVFSVSASGVGFFGEDFFEAFGEDFFARDFFDEASLGGDLDEALFGDFLGDGTDFGASETLANVLERARRR